MRRYPRTIAAAAAAALVAASLTVATASAAGPPQRPAIPRPDSITAIQDVVAGSVPVTRNDDLGAGGPFGAHAVTADGSGATPAGGSYQCGPTTGCRYTAPAGYLGTDSFTYRLAFPTSTTTYSTIPNTLTNVTMTIVANQPPVAVDDALTIHSPRTGTDAIQNDTDPNLGQVGEFADARAGDVHDCERWIGGFCHPAQDAFDCLYTVAPGFLGVDSFDYTIQDASGATDTGTVTITVTPNHAPVRARRRRHLPPRLRSECPARRDPGPRQRFRRGPGPAPRGAGLDLERRRRRRLLRVRMHLHPSRRVLRNRQVPVPARPTRPEASRNRPRSRSPWCPTWRRWRSTTSVRRAGNAPVSVRVFDNDHDPEGDGLGLLGYDATSALGGSVACGSDCTYTPPDGFVGVDTFQYTITDASAGANRSTATVTITVLPNTAPVAVADELWTDNYSGDDPPYSLPVGYNDTDADGDALDITYTSFTTANGTFVECFGRQCDATPQYPFQGIDTFSYTINDGHGGSATGSVVLHVGGNAPPTADHDSSATRPGIPVTVPVLVNDYDAAGPRDAAGRPGHEHVGGRRNGRLHGRRLHLHPRGRLPRHRHVHLHRGRHRGRDRRRHGDGERQRPGRRDRYCRAG